MKTVSLQDTPVTRFIRWMRSIRTVTPGITWEDAARYVLTRDPILCWDVLNQIGSWPSSEPELAALQRVLP